MTLRARTLRAMFGLAIVVAASAPMTSATGAGETIPCSCVANGQRVEVGGLFCIRSASGKRFLARCERVLNNTSWKRIQDGCPVAQRRSPTIG